MTPFSPPSDDRVAAAQGRHVVLVGMMGSGKTSVGRRVAERLRRPFLDSDAQVEARTGRTVREIFETDGMGELAFRALEAEALAEALARLAPSVISAAGGVVLDPTNRARLRESAMVVWLHADPAVLATRVTTADHRPLLGTDPLAVLTRMFDARQALYEEVAEGRRVDVGTHSIDQAVECVLELVS